MALINCNMSSTEAVIAAATTGDNIDASHTWRLVILPDNSDFVIAAELFTVYGLSVDPDADTGSFTYESASDNNIPEDIIKKITLSDASSPYSPSNKVYVDVDFEDGWSMPNNDYVITLDISGEARKANLIRVRAVVAVEKPGALGDGIVVTENPDEVIYEHHPGDKSDDFHYFTSVDLIDPELEFKLANISITANPNAVPSQLGGGEWCLQPIPVLIAIESQNEEAFYGLLKFSMQNVTQTYSATGLIIGYSFDLMFTPELELPNGEVIEAKSVDDHPWAQGTGVIGEGPSAVTVNAYVADGQYFNIITSRLLVEHVPIRAGVNENATGNVYSISTDAPNEGISIGVGPFWWQDYDFTDVVNNFVSSINTALQISASGTSNNNIVLTTDDSASFNIDVTEITNDVVTSLSGYPMDINLSTNTIPEGVTVSNENTSINFQTVNIPVDIPALNTNSYYSNGELTNVSKSFTVTIQASNDSTLSSGVNASGSGYVDGLNNTVVNELVQYPNPKIEVIGLRGESNIGTSWANANANGLGATQTGFPLAEANSLTYLPSCSVLSEDFSIKLEKDGNGFEGFDDENFPDATATDTVYLPSYDGNLAPPGYVAGVDSTSISWPVASPYPNHLESNSICVVNNISAKLLDTNASGKYDTAEITGTIHYEYYGTSDLTLQFNFEDIFKEA